MKRLYKSSTNRIISGVCGGVGEYFGFNPVTVRIVWLASVLFLGTGILAYIAAMILIPKNSDDKSTENYKNAKPAIGLILITFGAILLFQEYWMPISWRGFIGYEMMPAIGLILLGVFILIAGKERRMMWGDKTWSSPMDSSPDDSDVKWRNIRRSRKERFLLGICGGIGEKYLVDPVIIRLGWIGLIYITDGFGILVYFLLYLVIPLESVRHQWQKSD